MKRARGTTIPELMVVAAIMGILLYVSQRVVASGYEFYRFSDTSIRLQREAILALDNLGVDLQDTHQRSVVVVENPPKPVPAGSYSEDEVVIPLPKDLDGGTEVTDKAVVKWMSVAGWAIDTSRDDRPLMRYLGDTQHDVGNNFIDGGDYIVDIESVLPTEMPTVSEIMSYPDSGLRRKVVARNIREFSVHRSVDTIEVKLKVYLKGIQDLDNSLELETTIFPRN